MNAVYQFTKEKYVIADSNLDIYLEDFQENFMLPDEITPGEEIPGGRVVIDFWDSDQKVKRLAFIESEGKPSGEYCIFDRNGALEGRCHYRNQKGKSVLHGPSEFFFEDGACASLQYFFEGEQVGESIRYYPSGKLYSRMYFFAGALEGNQEYFYESSDKKSLLPYKKGRLHGQVSLFFPRNQLKRQVCFKDGQEHGLAKDWNLKGIQVRERNYEYGLCMSEKFWSHDGVLLEEWIAHSSEFVTEHRTHRKWDTKGSLRYQVEFEGNSFVHQEWDENGDESKKFEGAFIDGELQIEAYSLGKVSSWEAKHAKGLVLEAGKTILLK